MPTKNFIPGPYGKFNDFQATLIAFILANMAGWGLPTAATAEFTLLSNTVGKKKLRWEAIWAIILTNVYTHPQEVELKAARRDYEFGRRDDPTDTSIRLFLTRYIRNNPRVSDEQKAAMGLIVPDLVKTLSTHVFVGNNLVGTVSWGEHLVHHNEVLVPGQESKAKPDGVENIHVFIAFTAASVKEVPALDKFVYDGMVKNGKYDREFTIEQEAMRAWYYVKMMMKGKNGKYSLPSEIWQSVIM